MAEHRVMLEFDDGLHAKLVCPESGCEPATYCPHCGRHTNDPEGGDGCYDCKDGFGDECWIKSWFDNLTAEELLRGTIEVGVTVDASAWDEGPILHIDPPDPASPQTPANEGEGE